MKKIQLLMISIVLVASVLLSACTPVQEQEIVNENNTTFDQDKKSEQMKICTLEYAPVCGVDGVTYGNGCQAGDIEIAYKGECGKDNSANKEPKACTREYAPVCGVDGVTYSNTCVAEPMEIAYEGPCEQVKVLQE